jgi:DNA-binding PadR family transcriptional regulator
MHGYENCQKTKESNNNQLNLTEVAIYPTLHKLEKYSLLFSIKKKLVVVSENTIA